MMCMERAQAYSFAWYVFIVLQAAIPVLRMSFTEPMRASLQQDMQEAANPLHNLKFTLFNLPILLLLLSVLFSLVHYL